MLLVAELAKALGKRFNDNVNIIMLNFNSHCEKTNFLKDMAMAIRLIEIQN